ncbi:hypothetical protein NADFUDRAFT_46487 [Nadsonia fulvescens var. elongata DSM 6958]|uniref:Pre-mRNA-splicing factor CWC2 n=1 Tax=Nadsonia fulvescens var. elongata DSM 6958 TaxID=857566 RepID=A0A1E3PM35_9ASCO|nr:hypothetical protein NADFUDRAFT_46487 [Nadsonia fulvescens var. elongata DSM 6958]
MSIVNQESNEALPLSVVKDVHPSKETALEKSTAVVKPKKRKPRAARVQVDPDTITDKTAAQTGTIYNIWYNKWSGGDKEDGSANQQKADGRCLIARDSGYTKADSVANSYFCLHFARGLCHQGKKCEYLHRLPEDFDSYPETVDCFGRAKFNDYRDDMGGVGSFKRQNRTIYVGRINLNDNLEEVVARHFSEWGDIERIRVLNQKGVAFVTYKNLANAEFAREAMAHQSLDNDEVLNVRWATEDPNPAARAREKRRMEEHAIEVVKGLLPKSLVAELEASKNGNKRRKQLTAEGEKLYGLKNFELPEGLMLENGGDEPTSINSSEKRDADNSSSATNNDIDGINSAKESQQEVSLLGNNALQALMQLKNTNKKTTVLMASKTPIVVAKPVGLSSLVASYDSDSENED